MAEFVYGLCTLTSILCAWLLFRGYERSRTRLLFWSALCFTGLALNNALLLVDLYLFPEVDLFLPRTLLALAAVSVMLYGLIWDQP
jgi:uncharacterized protein DUF5985